MKLIKNNSRRLIEINGPQELIKDADGKILQAMDGTKIQLIPGTGKWIEVPEDVANCKFVAALKKAGDIEVKDGGESDIDDLSKMTKADLIEYADDADIEIDKAGTKAAIIAAINAAEDGEDE